MLCLSERVQKNNVESVWRGYGWKIQTILRIFMDFRIFLDYFYLGGRQIWKKNIFFGLPKGILVVFPKKGGVTRHRKMSLVCNWLYVFSVLSFAFWPEDTCVPSLHSCCTTDPTDTCCTLACTCSLFLNPELGYAYQISAFYKPQ